jgi:transposase
LIPLVCNNFGRFAVPWNEADRVKYEVIRARYSSDLSEAELALIAPLLPPPKRRGRKPTDARIILDALFYLIRCGCPWRYLPKDFPPFTTVQNRFYAWRDSGLWEQIISVLVMDAREVEGRQAAPTAVVVDSPVGQDNGSWRPPWFRRGQEGQGPQAPSRRRYDWPAHQMPNHDRRRAGPRRSRAVAEGRA